MHKLLSFDTLIFLVLIVPVGVMAERDTEFSRSPGVAAFSDISVSSHIESPRPRAIATSSVSTSFPRISSPDFGFARAIAWANKQITNFSENSWGQLPAITSNEEGYAVVWAGHDQTVISTENLFIQKLNRSGDPISSAKKLTNHRPCSCLTVGQPAIVWLKNKYGVAWTNNNLNNNGELEGQNMMFALVDTNGNILSSAQLSVSDDNTNDDRPYLKVRGGAVAIGWSGGELGIKQRYYAEVSAIDGSIVVRRKIASEEEWRLVTTPDFTGRVYSEKGNIYFKDGESIEQVNTVLGDNSFPYLNWDGEGYITVWMNDQKSHLELYFAKRVSTFNNFLRATR